MINEFLVVVDQFMTATAELADLVLPCTTYLETDDLVAAYGHQWLGLTRQVVPPLGEARSDVDILQALAGRLGFGDDLSGDPFQWMQRLLAPLADHGVTVGELGRRPKSPQCIHGLSTGSAQGCAQSRARGRGSWVSPVWRRRSFS